MPRLPIFTMRHRHTTRLIMVRRAPALMHFIRHELLDGAANTYRPRISFFEEVFDFSFTSRSFRLAFKRGVSEMTYMMQHGRAITLDGQSFSRHVARQSYATRARTTGIAG